MIVTGAAGSVGFHQSGESLSICLYTSCCPPTIGGAQTVLDQLARNLVARGHRPLVVAPASREPWDDRCLGYPVVRYRRPISKRFAVRAILPRLVALHVRHRFDLVHCHTAYPHAYVASTLRRLLGLPYVVRPHGADVLPGDEVRSSCRLDARMRKGLHAADAVIAQGEHLRDVIADVGVAAGRIHVVNNGVDSTAFRSAEPFPHPRPYLLGLGGLVPHKGFDLLLRAYARLPSPRPDLLIAGAGPEAASLSALACELGIVERVRFLGVVTGERKVGLYRSASLFVCPSRREPFANVILEAFAAGLPVVATDIGGNRELVRDGTNGLVCAPESADGMATAVQAVLSSPELAARLRSGALETGLLHDWSHVVPRYLAVYRGVIAGPRR